ncbi:carbon storage regulator CsrA [Homoserinimonas aerilata]|uniref:Translational regulator CsrA n=1 Tax=Homoserinimonas aerilata TaxID=1162970 RepID=A0A542YEZ7_9MICO|nr:carbon storage regulator [Homoserinimonas aerilata]TQL46641.1 carbon storage regulator CsrA [Homoserinimonas aerilata]
MLVLTRKPGERVLIGDDIVITILEGRGDGIRIGIDAPRGVKIQRAEIVQAVTEANVAAAQLSSDDAEAQLKAALGLALPAEAAAEASPAEASSAEPSSAEPESPAAGAGSADPA